MAVLQGNAKKSTVAGGFYPKNINGSLRFNPDDTSYLSWTPDSAGSQTTWTFSCWLKKCAFTSTEAYSIFGTGATNAEDTICYFQPAGESSTFDWIASRDSSTIRARITSYTANGGSAQFRDPSAWYHFVMVWDSTNDTSADRVRLYINGVRQTSSTGFVITEPSQNETSLWNSERVHYIGKMRDNADQIFDGYLADVHFIDGQALDADDFGELKNGVWVAKDYAGTYGTNGFYLTFEDDTEVEAFNTVLYRGNGGTQSITGMGFQPDLIWLKERNNATNHELHDVVRGPTKQLFSNSTAAEDTDANSVKSFDSDGFTLGSGGATNGSGDSYVAWGWKAGDSNVSNTDGDITSTVRANQTYGFSIVSYTGSGSAESVGHGLNDTPAFIITKNRTDGGENSVWLVWHQDRPNGYQYLNSTSAGGDTGGFHDTNLITSSTFGYNSTGANSTVTNETGDAYIAYCWAEKSGYSKFGSYEGDHTNGVTVACGFEPSMVLVKNIDASSDWEIYDDTRRTNGSGSLEANTSDPENLFGGNFAVTFGTTGFTLPAGTQRTSTNETGNTYIYAAFADTREAAFWLDQSGNDNDWQPVNLDHNDTVADSPTDNFCTLNPLELNYVTLSDGNLVVQESGGLWRSIRANFMMPTGQWYWEFEGTASASDYFGGGISRLSESLNSYVGQTANGYGILGFNGNKYNNGAFTFSSTFTVGDVIGVAFDADAGTLEYYKNGTSLGTAFTGLTSGDFFPAFSVRSSTVKVNFGQQPFKYDPPA